MTMSKPKTSKQNETMTKSKIVRAMAAAGIAGEVSGAGARWEVEVADEKTMRAFQRKVCRAGGYRTGYGAWVLQGEARASRPELVGLADPMHY
jgi:hypothetical protein